MIPTAATTTTTTTTVEQATVLPFPNVPSTSIHLPQYPSTPTTRPHASTSAALRRPPPASRSSTLGIKRLNSAQRVPHVHIQEPSVDHGAIEEEEEEASGRRRSTSAPQPLTRPRGHSDSSRRTNRTARMPPLNEDAVTSGSTTRPHLQPRPSWFNRRFPSQTVTSTVGLQRETSKEVGANHLAPLRTHEYNTNIVDLLDVVDPEVSTLSTLNNVQNSLFVPDLGRFINRRPTYALSPRDAGLPPNRRKTIGTVQKRVRTDTISAEEEAHGLNHVLSQRPRPDSGRDGHSLHTINSRLSDTHFAVLPHGLVLEDWSEHDKAELNDHVRHLLHSRREKFKRGWKGFKKYVSKREFDIFQQSLQPPF